MHRSAAVVILGLAFCLGACRGAELGLAGSRHAGFRGATLMTEYRTKPRTDTKFALAHVLFVLDRDIAPANGSGNSSWDAGSSEDHEMGVEYSDGDFSVQSHPVRFRKSQTVEADGKSFELAGGNLFVAMLEPDGSVNLTQLPRTLPDGETSAESIVDVMKTLAPGNVRLQAVVPH